MTATYVAQVIAGAAWILIPLNVAARFDLDFGWLRRPDDA